MKSHVCTVSSSGSKEGMLTQWYNIRVISQCYREIKIIQNSTNSMISCCTDIYPNRLIEFYFTFVMN